MTPSQAPNAIAQDVAYQLCADIRRQYAGKWYTFAGLQCWGCAAFSQGDPARMCVGSRPDYRGCNLVNVRYDREQTAR
jgi:hypothetical protein